MSRLLAVFFAAALRHRVAWMLAFLAFPGQAQLVSVPDGAFVDRQTGLVWQMAQGRETWAQAASAIPGFRLASIAEVSTLFEHAGIEAGSGRTPDAADPQFAAVDGLISRFGCVLCGRVSGFEFWTLDAGTPGTHGLGSLFTGYDPGINEYRWSAFCCGFAPDDRFDPMVSAALFVQIVPEPQTWALLLLGGGALIARARRRRSTLSGPPQ